jgi:hypothetical protein
MAKDGCGPYDGAMLFLTTAFNKGNRGSGARADGCHPCAIGLKHNSILALNVIGWRVVQVMTVSFVMVRFDSYAT